jgi:hypothetical protein
MIMSGAYDVYIPSTVHSSQTTCMMEAEDAGGINGRDVRRSLWRRTSIQLEGSVLANKPSSR